MKFRAWSGLLFAGFLICIANVLVPAAAVALTFVYCTIAVAAAWIWSSRLSPATRRGTRLFAAAGTSVFLGGIVQAIHAMAVDTPNLFPSLGDPLNLVGYCFLFWGEVRLVRSRTTGRDIDAWLDSLLIVVAVGIGLWMTIMRGYLGDATEPLGDRVMNGGYFILALALFATTLRVLAARGVRSMSYFLLLGGVLMILGFEIGSSLARALGQSSEVLAAGAPLIFGLLTAALMHPSVPYLTARPDDFEPQLRPGRAVLLAGAMLIPQAAVLIGYEQLTRLDLVVLGLGTVVLGSLVMARFIRLVRAREALLDNETGLREFGELLLETGTSREVLDTASSSIGKLLPARTRLAGLRNGTRHPEAAQGFSGGSRLHADLDIVRRCLDSVEPEATETSEAVQAGGVELFLFAARGKMGDDDLWVWSLSQGALGRHERQALRSLAREMTLALRGVEAMEMRAREESERRWKESIIRSERRFRALVQHSSDIVAVIDLEGNLTYVSPAVTKLLGYEPIDVTGQSVLELIHPEDQQSAGAAFDTCRAGQLLNRVELRVLDTTGYPHVMEVALADHMDTPDVEGLVINARDVTAARELEESLERAAKHDAKTGLLNRSSLDQEIAVAIDEARGRAHEAAVLLVRLEQFELITDGLGFEALDQILAEAADRIRQAVRLVDVVARVDGPQFAVLVRHTYGASETEQLANRVLAALSGSIEYDGQSVPLSARIGIAMSGTQYGDDLLRLGHAALGAGASTGNKIQGFESPMVESVMEQLELRTRLEDAIANDELFLLYQPIVSLETGLIQGAEALVRWRHPQRGVIGPIHFIPIAEESGLVIPLGEWVLRDVCRQVAEWERDGILAARMTFSLNLSAVQLADPRTPSIIADAIADSGVDPTRLVVELTETFFVDGGGDDTVEALQMIRELGLQVAIDDFGTGYSSLGRIARFPIDIIKIDRAFVSPLDAGDDRDLEMLKRIIEIIRGLGVVSVAEGIETASEAEVLRSLGCEKGQGYFFDRPMEAGRLAERIVEASSRTALS